MERLSSSCECNIMGRWDVRFLFSVVSFEISSIIFWKTATVNCSCIVPTTIIIWPSRYGYVLAASKLNIRHEIWNLQTVCWTSFPSLDSAHILWLFRSLEPQRNYWERLRCCTTTLKSRCWGRVCEWGRSCGWEVCCCIIQVLCSFALWHHCFTPSFRRLAKRGVHGTKAERAQARTTYGRFQMMLIR